jgi:hypothetical protein
VGMKIKGTIENIERAFFILLCGFLLVFAGCEEKMKDPKGSLEKQAGKYWQERLINKNFEYTYKEEVEKGLPAFSTYKEELNNVTKFPTSSVTVKEAKVEGDVGTVKLVVMCRLPSVPKEIPVPIGDIWVVKGNKWRHQRQIKPPGKK